MDFGPSKSVRVLQSISTKKLQTSNFVLSTNVETAVLLHCLVEKIVVVNNGKHFFFLNSCGIIGKGTDKKKLDRDTCKILLKNNFITCTIAHKGFLTRSKNNKNFYLMQFTSWHKKVI